MSIASGARRLAAKWHARRHADYLVLEYIQSLERSTSVVRDEMSFVDRDRFTVSGRYVAGRMMAWALIVVLFGSVAAWWTFGDGAERFREDVMRGRADAISRAHDSAK